MSTTEHHEYSTKLGHLRFFKNVIPCLPMKHIILIALSLSLFAFSLHATKPDNAGKPDQQKTVQNQSNAHHSDSDAVKSKTSRRKKRKKKRRKKKRSIQLIMTALKRQQARATTAIRRTPSVKKQAKAPRPANNTAKRTVANGGSSGAKKNNPTFTSPTLISFKRKFSHTAVKHWNHKDRQ